MVGVFKLTSEQNYPCTSRLLQETQQDITALQMFNLVFEGCTIVSGEPH